jgi:hypothetical protein
LQQYGEAGKQKFIENLVPICERGATVVYRVPERLQ